MKVQSEALTKFYQAYLAWVEAGAPVENEHSLYRGVGLCSNLWTFFGYADASEAYELDSQFRDAELSVFYPFNEGSVHYRQEKAAETCHLNPARIEWVRRHVAIGLVTCAE